MNIYEQLAKHCAATPEQIEAYYNKLYGWGEYKAVVFGALAASCGVSIESIGQFAEDHFDDEHIGLSLASGRLGMRHYDLETLSQNSRYVFNIFWQNDELLELLNHMYIEYTP